MIKDKVIDIQNIIKRNFFVLASLLFGLLLSLNIYLPVLNYLDHEKKNEFSDTTILVSEHSEGINLKENILSEFKNKIKISDVFKGKSKDPRNLVKYKEKKKLFTVRTNKLKMCTIKSFKGWERRNIIIVTDSDENTKNKKKY